LQFWEFAAVGVPFYPAIVDMAVTAAAATAPIKTTTTNGN
jgi:hypothetical protein